MGYLGWVWIAYGVCIWALGISTVGPVHYSRDPQTFFFPLKLSLKMGLTVLFTHLKIILLQYF